MKKLLILAAGCAVCALATSQPMPMTHEGERMENHEMSRGEPIQRPYAERTYRVDERHDDDRHEPHHRHKVWVPEHHEHGHQVSGHYEWR